MNQAKWYVLHTYSGHEAKIKTNIEHRATLEGFRDHLLEIMIPSESVVEIKDGKKRNITRNLMPGYVIIHMVPNNDLIETITKISGVAGFVGDGTNPIPLSEDEVKNIKSLMEEKHEKPKPRIKYRPGEQVRVIEGPFSNFIGTVNEIDEEKSKIKMMVSIFGRPTPVELDVMQVESL